MRLHYYEVERSCSQQFQVWTQFPYLPEEIYFHSSNLQTTALPDKQHFLKYATESGVILTEIMGVLKPPQEDQFSTRT